MKEVLLEELMDMVAIAEASPAFSVMLSLVETCVLELGRNALLYQIGVSILDKGAWGWEATNISLKHLRHKLYTVIAYIFVCLLFVYPKIEVFAPIFIKEKVSKCGMMWTDWAVRLTRDVEDCMHIR